jgi:hypothetical protein
MDERGEMTGKAMLGGIVVLALCAGSVRARAAITDLVQLDLAETAEKPAGTVNDAHPGLCTQALPGAANGSGLPRHLSAVIGAVLRPIKGYSWKLAHDYVQGSSSVKFPKDFSNAALRINTMVRLNDTGSGYYFYRSRTAHALLAGVRPMLKFQMQNLLSRRAASIDSMGLTELLVFQLPRQCWLTVGNSEDPSDPGNLSLDPSAQLGVSF